MNFGFIHIRLITISMNKSKRTLVIQEVSFPLIDVEDGQFT